MALLCRWLDDEKLFRNHVVDFGDALSAAIAEYKKAGLARCLRKLIGDLNLDLRRLQVSADYYDLCTQFIVNHEAAHAYTGQIMQGLGQLSQDDRRSFEFVADLVATEWLYNRMVRNTPDTQEYREFKGFEEHSESIFNNTWTAVQSQVLVLLVFAIASAMRKDGSVSLEGGRRHPHGFLRHFVQQVHFMTLVLSNQGKHLSDEAVEMIDSNWDACLSLFLRSGLINVDEVKVLLQKDRFADLGRAADLIARYDIRELRKAAPFLRTLEQRVPAMAKGDQRLDLLSFIETSSNRVREGC